MKMQNWRTFATLSSAAGSGLVTARTGRPINLEKQIHRLLNTANQTNGSNANKRASASTISSSRKQSTTQTKLAASQVPLLRKEMTSAAEEEEEGDDDSNINVGNRNETGSLFNVSNSSISELGSTDSKLFNEQSCLPETHRFVHRHIGPRESDLINMLNELGYSTLDELVEATIPDEIRLRRDLNLPEAITEDELLEKLKELGAKNDAINWKSFIGMGYYDCITPSVIQRNIFENAGWTTAYTAYQAEIAQGRLESLMNYQTMVSDLTGLDVSNASLLDESTAAAEALQVCLRHDRSKRNKLLISSRCHPQTIAVVETRAKALGVQLDYFDELDGSKGKSLEDLNLNEYSGLLIQYPNTQGYLFDLDKITKPCHEADCLVVVATDLMACTLFKPPGDFEYPADLAIGTSQRFGIPLNYGGPHAGFLACKQKLVRSIPGRVVGLTRDSSGNKAYRFALQTREQHIRRDKATSNICTAQALLANMSAMFAVYHGPEGLKAIASTIHAKTSLLAHLIKQRAAKIETGGQQQRQVSILNDGCYFDTLTLEVADQSALKRRARQSKINLRYEDDGTVGISLDETTKMNDIFRLASLFNSKQIDDNHLSHDGRRRIKSFWQNSAAFEANNQGDNLTLMTPLNSNELATLKRTSLFLTHDTFNKHRSEAQLVRYMKSLENKDISLTHSMIPLGSCTMKLNATSQMIAASWPEFTKCHPFQPTDQCKGYMKLFNELNDYLCEITGYDRISFQPNSGAQGEYAGLRVIKSYLESSGKSERNVCLIPISAHGTNPASAQMAGFKIQTIKVREDGNIDLDDLRKNIDKFRDQLACLMITYPSTFGVFEDGVRLVCDLVHEAGGQVYLDGANMNAQVGLCRPGDYGSDVSHLNLHKTFCIPHGGGGPGAGPIGVKEHLIPFLPSHPLINDQTHSSTKSFGTVSSSMWGSPVILPISWSYIRMMSSDLKLSSQVAILSANYMRKRLEGAYKILFKGVKGNVAHEFIIDCRPFKKTANIEAVDIAKRLQDFGFHAPTVSWPVTNTLMIEPTESEDKDQLDRYCDALLAIRDEIADIENGKMDKINNPIKNAPHTQQVVCSSEWKRPYSREQAAFPGSQTSKIWPTVGRVDDTYGDTNLFCSCQPTSVIE